MRLKSIALLLAATSSIFCSALAFADDKLIFAIDVIRHGDRTPLNSLPNESNIWPEGIGELTGLGMQQEYLLGSRLRARYVSQAHLLPANFNQQNIFIRSSDYNRTLMSAQSFLYGLYPIGTGPMIDGKPALPSGFQPVPIHTQPEMEDGLLIPGKDKNQLMSLLEKYVFVQKEWQEKNVLLQADFRQWSQATGLPITNLFQVIPLGDNLYVRLQHKAPLPVGISQEEADRIINLASWALAASYKPREIGSAFSYELMNEMQKNIAKATQGETTAKFILYSAHDTTIMSVLSAMEAPADAQVPYASDLNFSLFQANPGDYYIRVTLNDNPVNIPACNNGPKCTLDQFNSLIHNINLFAGNKEAN